jgi:hypothetical protein
MAELALRYGFETWIITMKSLSELQAKLETKTY